jgi:hypothetical protein
MTVCTARNCSYYCEDDPPSLECAHKLCPDHLRQLIRSNIDTGNATIKCPSPGCGRAIKDANVVKWIDKNDKDK